MARELSAYTVVDASAVPGKLRRGYASTAAGRWSPFADPQFHFEWNGGKAMVWAWSRAGVLEGDGLEAVSPPRRLTPESLYRGQPRADGESLLAMDRGVEGRVWRNYLLGACQWWPQVPSQQEWNQFRRAAGLAPEASMPAVEASELADRTWTPPRAAGLADVVTRHRALAVALACGLGVAVLSAQLAAGLSLVVACWQVDNEIAAQDRGVQTILAAREKAMVDATAVDALLALRPPAGQIQLLTAVSALLPAGGWKLLDWRMPDPGKLELVAQMPKSDPQALVESWEASGRFRNVTVELGRDAREVDIKAEIVPAAPAGKRP